MSQQVAQKVLGLDFVGLVGQLDSVISLVEVERKRKETKRNYIYIYIYIYVSE